MQIDEKRVPSSAAGLSSSASSHNVSRTVFDFCSSLHFSPEIVECVDFGIGIPYFASFPFADGAKSFRAGSAV